MKLIYKHQRGGQFLNFFTTYKPVIDLLQLTSSLLSTATKSSSSKEDNGNFNMKEVLSVLDKIDGLPNEINDIELKVLDLNQYVSVVLDIDPNATNLMYIQIMHDLKMALFNKKEYDKAYQLMIKNGGENEILIDNGYIYAYDKDKKLTNVSIQEYLKNKDKYHPLTSSNILWLRAHDPQFSNNNLLFSTLTNAIGMKEVVNQIKSNLNSLGSTENNLSGYVNKGEGGAVKSGIQQLLLLAELLGEAAIKGIYKVKTESKNSTKQAEAAIQWIWNSLTPNALQLLMLKGGDSKNPSKGALNLLSLKVMSVMNNSITYDEDYQDDFNVDGTVKPKEGSSNGEDKSFELNTSSLLLAGYGQKEQFTINPGTNVANLVTARTLPLVKKDGTPLGSQCSLLEVTEGQFGPILNLQKATMGGRKIDPIYFNQVLISDGMIRSIDYPVNPDGTPDLSPSTLSAKKEADELIKQAGIDIDDPKSVKEHSLEINAILQKVGLNAAYNSLGELIHGNWARFAVMNGTADNRALSIDPLSDNNHLLNEITDDNKIELLINTILNKANIEKLSFDKNNMGWFEGDYDMFLEGTIWIPMNVNYFNSQAGSGEKIKPNTAQDLYVRLELRDRRDTLLREYNHIGLPE